MGLTRIVSFASTDFLGFLHSLWSSSGFGGGFGTVLHSLVLGVVLGLWCLVVSGGIMVARVWISLGLLLLPGSLSRFLFEIYTMASRWTATLPWCSIWRRGLPALIFLNFSWQAELELDSSMLDVCPYVALNASPRSQSRPPIPV